MPDMRALMAPRSVAVVGATERAGAPAGYVMRNLLRLGYAGRIVPVNPRAESVFGIAAVTSVAALDVPVDAVVIGIAAEQVNAALDAAGRSGARAAVVLASGFAELDAAGAERQRELREIARRHDMAVCGPNCLGLVNLATGAALYSSSLSAGVPRGRMAILSHSGAGAIALANAGRFGLSHIVSSGNSATTDLADYLDYLVDDPDTEVVGLVLEAVGDPSDLSRVMERMQAAGKPVIALRAGRSAGGARATAAHTGALAGADDAYRAFFRRTGIVEVADMDGYIETAALFLQVRRPPERRGVAIVGVSGGGVAHAADIADEIGLELPDLAPPTIERLRALLPPFATPRNPLDTTGVVFADGGIYRDVLGCLAADPGVGLIVAAQDAPAGLDDAGAAEYFGIADAVAEHAARSAWPVVFMSNLSGGHHPAVAARLPGVPVLRGTRAALTAVHSLVTRTRPISWSGLAARDGGGAGALLDEAWLVTPRGELTRDAAAAATAAAAIGFPVAMTIESPDIAHKSEAGGVRLAIADADAASAAFEAIMASTRAYAPGADLRGVWVREMVTGGVEALVGLVRHPPFGLGIVVGTGGTLVELAGDAAFELLPIDHGLADALIGRTRLATLLAGYRAAPRADRRALVDLLVHLSDFATHHGEAIEALDLNPVAVLPEGRGVCVLDVLLVPRAVSGP